MKASNYMEVSSSPNCLFQGELEQRRKIGTWTKRQCVIWEKQLLCYNSEEDVKPRVFFSLDGFQIAVCSSADDQHLFAFQLSKPAVVDHTFAARSQDELDKWIQKLLEAGVTPTSEKLNHDQAQDQKTISAVNSVDSSDSVERTENPDTSRKSLQSDAVQNPTEGIIENSKNQVPDTLSTDYDSHQAKETEIDGTINKSNITNFPSLDVESLPVAAPFIHTSQSFDETQISKLGTSPQLQRSNEIEDLLKIREQNSLTDDDFGLKFKQLDVADDANSQTHSLGIIKLVEEDEVFCGSECQATKDDRATTQDTVSENNLNLDAAPVEALSINLESSHDTVADSTTEETLIAENQKLDADHADTQINQQNLIDFDTDSNTHNELESEHSPAENKFKEDLAATDTQHETLDQVSEEAVAHAHSENPCVQTSNQDLEIECSNKVVISDTQLDNKPQKTSHLHAAPNFSVSTKLKSKNQHSPHPQQYVGSIRKPDKFNSESQKQAVQHNPSIQDESKLKNVQINDTHDSALEKENTAMPLTCESNGSDVDEVAQCVKNVSVKELKDIFSSSNFEPVCKPNNAIKPIPHQNGKLTNVQMSSKEDVQSLTTLPHSKIASYINIAFECSPLAPWRRVWGVISKDIIQFFSSKEKPDQMLLSFHVVGVDVKPAAWETGRLLAFKLVQNQKLKVIIEPEDVESLGRWVSGLFQVIQQPVVGKEPTLAHTKLLKNDVLDCSTSLATSSENEQTLISQADDENQVEVSSVKEILALFEEMKPEPKNRVASPRTSIHSSSPSSAPSISSSISSPNCGTFSCSTSLVQQHECANSFSNSSNGFSNGSSHLLPVLLSVEDKHSNSLEFKTRMENMEAKYADVVCWLGRYIEQDEEKKVLSSTSNPFLAKLRLRHKLEMIARLEMSGEETEKKIQYLKDQLEAKEASKGNISERHRGRLIRNAEDARRMDDDRKRIDKECAAIQAKIKKAEKELAEIIEAVEAMQQEVQLACDKFDWGNDHNGNNSVKHDECEQDYIEQDDNKEHQHEGLPDWTKMAKAKAQAWQKIGNLQ